MPAVTYIAIAGTVSHFILHMDLRLIPNRLELSLEWMILHNTISEVVSKVGVRDLLV